MSLVASNLQRVLFKADTLWETGVHKKQYEADVTTLKAVKEQQTAQLELVVQGNGGKKKAMVRATWLENCALAAQDCTDDCNITGPEASSDSQDYDLNLCKEVPFKVAKEEAPRGNFFSGDDLVAHNLLASMKILDEWYNQQIVASLELNAGTPDINRLPPGFTWDPVEEQVVITPALANSMGGFNLLTYMAKVNKYTDPWLLSGFMWWLAYTEAQQNEANLDGKGDAVRSRLMPAYFDVQDLDTAVAPDFRAFLMQKGSLAAYDHAWYKDAPKEFRIPQSRMAIESRNVPGLFYDLIEEESCGTGSEVFGAWKVKLNAALLYNPTICNSTDNGVVKILGSLGV